MYVILYSYLLSKSLSQVAKWVWLLYLCRCHVWVALLPLAGGRWRRPLQEGTWGERSGGQCSREGERDRGWWLHVGMM